MSIGYCSLEEAWGNNFSDRYEKDINYAGGHQFNTGLQSVVNNDINNENNYNTNIENNNINVEKDDNICLKKSRLEKILDSLEKLEKRIIDIENLYTNKKKTIENFDNNSNGSYIEYIILILMGIVIIYVMDSILKIGKKIGTKISI